MTYLIKLTTMKKILLTIITIITLCSFGDNKHKLQRRQGVLIHTNKGYEFIPMEDWKDYTPKQFDTCYQFRTV